MTAYPLQRLHQSAAPLRDAIISSLRSAIEIGELRPGARLVERLLCEQLAVSRTSLREALRELVADGLIVQGPDRSLVVAGISEEEARSVYSLRGAIQGIVVAEFIERADEVGYRDFLHAARVLQAAYRRGDVAEILMAKRLFYARLCAGARNPVALSLIERLCLRVSGFRSRAPGRAERNEVSAAEIGGIASAIAARDTARAKTAMLDHMDSVARWALASLAFQPQSAPRAPASTAPVVEADL